MSYFEQSCPMCGTARYSRTDLQLFVAPCGHDMCDTCLDLRFQGNSRHSIRCPNCAETVTRDNYVPKVFESGKIHREVALRRKYLSAYNKTEADFPAASREETLRLYNDYLAHVEDLAFNLINNIDVEATLEEIRQYTKNNAAQIAATRKAKADYRRQRERERAHLQQSVEEKTNRLAKEVKEQKAEDALEKERLFRRVVGSNAKGALAQYTNKQAKKSQGTVYELPGTLGAPVGQRHEFGQLPQAPVGSMYLYKRPQLPVFGPMIPPTPALAANSYVAPMAECLENEHAAAEFREYGEKGDAAAELQDTVMADAGADGVAPPMRDPNDPQPRLLASGFRPEMAVKRAIGEAFSCLFWDPSS